MTPDSSLPINTTIKIDGNITTIDGGTKAGNNLFHSFKDFSISNGTTVHFNNTSDVQNIITRITGGSASQIDGLISANGTANLFLINPSGIVFGANARLDIGGSFLATTAESLEFPNGSFSATNPQAPLLTINTPIGLRFNNTSGVIRVEGTGNQIQSSFSFSPTKVDNISGLKVQSGNTIALVGSNIEIQGGSLSVEGGHIELSSITSGLVNFQHNANDWSFNYEGVFKFNSISLSKTALIDTSGGGYGSIKINGSNVILDTGSLLLIQNKGTVSSGSLDVNAFNSLILKGTSSDGTVSSAIRSESLSEGDGSTINIFAPLLVLQDGGRIGATAYSTGKGGNVSINASNSVKLLENSSVNTSRQTFTVSSIAATTYGSGNAGDIQISTSNLRTTAGGSVTSTTIGTGHGGNVTINANTVEVIGLELATRRASTISAASAKAGDAGNLTINTSQLYVEDGGLVSTSSFDTGTVGNLTINASNEIKITGQKYGIVSSIRASEDSLFGENRDQERLGTLIFPNTFSGQIIITTKLLNINQGGLITVRNQNIREAGKLQINAESLKLNQGSITATTEFGKGGNIVIHSQDLQLHQTSIITATAGNNGNGGNINIYASLIVVQDNSQITANAFEGRGGNIQINTKGFFISPDTRITASSQRGINGTVQINVDTYLNEIPVKPETIQNTPEITSVCQGRSSGNNEFVITGTGGLPPSPEDLPDTQSTWQINSTEKITNFTPPTDTNTIVEAQGWVKNPDGSIELTAEANVVNPDTNQSASSCNFEENTKG